MSERYTLDTNILFYSVDSGAGQKHVISKFVVTAAARSRSPLVLQTLGELCHSVRRKRPAATPLADRFAARSLELFEMIPAMPEYLTDALETHYEHGIPFWDAMLVVAARRAGCSILLTEDMQDGRTLSGLTFRNPLLFTQAELNSLLP